METKIISQKKNPFLDREEILISIKSDIAPSYDDVKKAVKKEESLTVIKRINSNFGKNVFNAEVVVYGSIESKNKIETIPKKIRKKIEAERKEKEAEAKATEEAKSKEAVSDISEEKVE